MVRILSTETGDPPGAILTRLWPFETPRIKETGSWTRNTSFGTMSQVFHFNHIKPEKKHPNYDNLIRRVVSAEVLDEVDKCVLLCSICHGVLHGQRDQGTLTITNVVRGREMSQTITGQIIMQLPSNKFETPKVSLLEKILGGQP